MDIYLWLILTHNKKTKKHNKRINDKRTTGSGADLLPQQLIVHLHPLHLLVALLQSLVVLAKLSDVVAGFGQDASFTLETTESTQTCHNVTPQNCVYFVCTALTAPVLLSTLQSGMILERVTIQLLILSLLLLSTAKISGALNMNFAIDRTFMRKYRAPFQLYMSRAFTST